jgi:hypothetical protein
VKRLLAMMIVLCASSSALGWPTFSSPQAAQTAHPAVVRVTALERSGASLGSGVLVAVSRTHGLVVTNWHVVRDASGPILVSFPDGFGCGAVVLATDHTWDLAALAITRPRAQPVMIATEPPRPGEVLTIAGYGRDSYRAISGRCTEYLSPGGSNPNEIVELDVAARQGDSGGPIFNARGELAGVLFGSNDSFFAGQYTMGSYCGRVRRFLASAAGDFERLPGNSPLLAQQAAPRAAAVPAVAIVPQEPPPSYYQTPGATAGLSSSVTRTTGSPGDALPDKPAVAPGPVMAAAQPSRAEQIKTILAAIGAFAVLFHGIRLIGAAAG